MLASVFPSTNPSACRSCKCTVEGRDKPYGAFWSPHNDLLNNELLYCSFSSGCTYKSVFVWNMRDSSFPIISTMTNLPTAYKLWNGLGDNDVNLWVELQILLTKILLTNISWLTSEPKAKKAEEWGISVHISHSPKIVELFSIILWDAQHHSICPASSPFLCCSLCLYCPFTSKWYQVKKYYHKQSFIYKF